MSGIVLRLRLLTLALAIAAAIVFIANIAIGLILGEALVGGDSFGMIDALDVAVMQLIVAAIPLLVLALAGSRSRRLWWISGVLTALFWTYVVIQTWVDSLSNFEGGANIGMGLIMLASPVLVLICVGLARLLLGPSPRAGRLADIH